VAKILVILLVLIISFFLAQSYSEFVFNRVGLSNFVGGFSGGLSDTLILGSSKNMLKSVSDEGKEVFDSASGMITHSREDSKKTFEHINQLREENNVKKIVWDDKLYDLAKWKAEDMTDKGYFDHVDPSGKCVGNYAKNFGLSYSANSMADNLFGYDSPTIFDQDEAVDSWMGSRGHRYNLLYSGHRKGAIACDSKNCVFIGQGGSGWVCDTGEAGLAFWNSAGEQSGER
jgi:uncharacterized protein YkwD